MHIGVIGINHKSAPLSLQEKVAKACARRLSLESLMSAQFSCVVLCTCNRSEVYFTTEDLTYAHSTLLSLWREEIDEPFEHRVYTYFGTDCFAHLATVISGWDSLVLGETQIHRQVRMAYENAKLHYTLKSPMHYLFQKSLKIAKNIRSQLAHRFLSLPEILWKLIHEVMGPLSTQKILLIGNSEMNRKILAFLHKKRISGITLSTRAPLSARDLLESYALEIRDWSELSSFGHYDLVICSTHASEYVLRDLGEEHMTTQLIIDLSVPRVVDPELTRHKTLALWNMEQIGLWIGKEVHGDPAVAQKIWTQVERYATLFSSKKVHSS